MKNYCYAYYHRIFQLQLSASDHYWPYNYLYVFSGHLVLSHFGTCKYSNVETMQSLLNLSCFRNFEIRTSLGTSVFASLHKRFCSWLCGGDIHHSPHAQHHTSVSSPVVVTLLITSYSNHRDVLRNEVCSYQIKLHFKNVISAKRCSVYWTFITVDLICSNAGKLHAPSKPEN